MRVVGLGIAVFRGGYGRMNGQWIQFAGDAPSSFFNRAAVVQRRNPDLTVEVEALAEASMRPRPFGRGIAAWETDAQRPSGQLQ